MVSKRVIAVIVLSAIMLVSAGCTGWGDDGPSDPPEEETDGNGEAQEDVDPSDSDEGGVDADEPPESDGSDVEDAEEDSSENESDVSDEDERSQEDSGPSDDDEDVITPDTPDESDSDESDESDETDDSNESDETDEDGDESNESDEADENSDNGEADPEEGEEDPEVYSLYVEADSEVTLERNWEDASTTREPTDGVVEFSVIEGEYTLSADGYEDMVVEVGEDMTVQMSETEEMNTLTVKVDDVNGDPVEGATVEAVGADDHRNLHYEGETNEDGIAEFEVAQNANYILYIEADGYQDEQREISLEREVSIELEPEDEETHTLTVETQQEVPVTLKRFSDGATTERTASDGAVEFTVSEGYYGASADGHYDIHEEFAVHVDEDTTITLQSTDGERIEVTVVDAESGEPIQGAEISGVCDWWYTSGDAHIVGETNSDGVAQPETITPTSCDSSVSADGYEDKSVSLSVPDDDGRVIELEPEEPITHTRHVTSLARL